VGSWLGHLRRDFIRGISAHHMQDRQSTPGVFVEPRVESQDEVFEDDDGTALGNEALDGPVGHNLVAIHGRCRDDDVRRADVENMSTVEDDSRWRREWPSKASSRR